MNSDDIIQPKILKILNAQRRSGQYCDLIIKLTNNYQLYGHFCVIAPQSDFIGGKYFVQQTMQFSIHNPLEIELCNFECEQCLYDILNFMYCEDVTIVGSDHEQHFKHLVKLLNIQELNQAMENDSYNLQLPPVTASDSNLTTDDVTNIPEKLEMILQIEDLNDNNNVTAAKASEINAAATTTTIVGNVDIVKIVEKKIERDQGLQYKIQTERAASKKIRCSGCAFKCYRRGDMLNHLYICVSPNTNCSLCDKVFDTLENFRGHLIRHENGKPYFCYDCDARFDTKTALNLHTPKHSTDAPFMCWQCGRCFKWKHALNSHMIIHSTEKAHLCDECGFSTAHLKTLRAHQLSHVGLAFRCPEPACGYTSRRKENLKTHIATHRKETLFVCEICGRRFSQNKNLKRHSLLHMPNTSCKNQFKCPHCEFRTYRKDKLKEHVQRMHTEKPLQLELPEILPSLLDTAGDFLTTSSVVDDDGGDNIENKKKYKKITKRSLTKRKLINHTHIPHREIQPKPPILPLSAAATASTVILGTNCSPIIIPTAITSPIPTNTNVVTIPTKTTTTITNPPPPPNNQQTKRFILIKKI